MNGPFMRVYGFGLTTGVRDSGIAHNGDKTIVF
jgi:hypothetical protein